MLENKYYCYFHGYCKAAKTDLCHIHCGNLFRIYRERGEKSAKEGFSKNGKIPDDAIEMYNKHYDLKRMVKSCPEYVNAAKEHYKKYNKDYYGKAFYELIKKNSPANYKGDPWYEDEK